MIKRIKSFFKRKPRAWSKLQAEVKHAKEECEKYRQRAFSAEQALGDMRWSIEEKRNQHDARVSKIYND